MGDSERHDHPLVWYRYFRTYHFVSETQAVGRWRMDDGMHYSLEAAHCPVGWPTSSQILEDAWAKTSTIDHIDCSGIGLIMYNVSCTMNEWGSHNVLTNVFHKQMLSIGSTVYQDTSLASLTNHTATGLLIEQNTTLPVPAIWKVSLSTHSADESVSFGRKVAVVAICQSLSSLSNLCLKRLRPLYKRLISVIYWLYLSTLKVFYFENIQYGIIDRRGRKS
jgi:hypothetical protein